MRMQTLAMTARHVDTRSGRCHARQSAWISDGRLLALHFDGTLIGCQQLACGRDKLRIEPADHVGTRDDAAIGIQQDQACCCG